MEGLISSVQLGGRIHAGFADKTGAVAVHHRSGPLLAAHYPGGPVYKYKF